MPTFNQLIKQGRQQRVYKSKSPVLQKGFNTLENAPTDISSPQTLKVSRKALTAFKPQVAAYKALFPAHGAPPACAALPL